MTNPQLFPESGTENRDAKNHQTHNLFRIPKNYYPDNEIDNVVWEQYAVASCGNSQVLPEGILDWFRKRMPEPCEDYIKDTEIALQQPNADNRFSPAELNFMWEQVAAWQQRDLTQRVAEVVTQPKPMPPAL